MKDGDMFACIALTNPTEVMLVDHDGNPLGIKNFDVGGAWERGVLEITAATSRG